MATLRLDRACSALPTPRLFPLEPSGDAELDPAPSPDALLSRAAAPILEGKAAWCDIEAVTELVGVEAVAELAGAGLVELWERRDGAFLTLTPLGAFRLGVALREVWEYGRDEHGERVAQEIPRWCLAGDERVGAPLPPPLYAKERGQMVGGLHFELLVDDGLGPVDEAIARELRQVVMDPVSGQPIELFCGPPEMSWDPVHYETAVLTVARGHVIGIDPRLAKGARKAPGKKARKRARKASRVAAARS